MDLSTREGRRQQGERIKEAARAAGLTLDELARRIGCSRALIFQYASGASLAQTDRLQQIGELVGKPLYWFFLDGDQPVAGGSQAPNAELEKERRLLNAEREQFELERARHSDRSQRSDVAYLEGLLSAVSSPIDHKKIVEYAQQLHPLLARLDDKERLASVLFQQGNALVHLQDWGGARERLQQSADLYRAVGKLVQMRDCLQSLGHANLMLGRVDEALQQFALVADSDDWTNRWQGTLSIGAAHEFRGEYSAAIACFDEALNVVEEHGTGEDTETARLFVEANWANLELDFGDYRQALGRASRCVQLAQKHGVQEQYLEALLTKGIAHLCLNSLHEGYSAIQSALDLSQLTGDRQHRSLALAAESLYHSSRGHAELAVTSGKEALALALRISVVRAEILAQRALCEAYLLTSNSSEALYHAEQGLSVSVSHGLRLAQTQFLSLIGRSQLAAGRAAEAEITALKAMESAELLQVRPLMLELSILRTRAALALNRSQHALEEARRSAQLYDSMHLEHDIWRAKALEAIAVAANGDLEQAMQSYKSAAQGIERARAASVDFGEDRCAEDPIVNELWRTIVTLIARSESLEAALQHAESINWPPLLDWFKLEFGATQSHTGGSDNA